MPAPESSAPAVQTQPKSWTRRIRVPLGFVTAAVFLVFARPTLLSLLLGLPLVLAGLWLRGYAAGYVKKNAELTTTGPYAYTRNPLYLGSAAMAAGIAVASARWWLIVLLAGMFALIYTPTILSEEEFLRGRFVGWNDYASHVPRLLPRLRPARFANRAHHHNRFDWKRYLRHREYNASVGAAAIYAALLVRLLWLRQHH